MKIVGSIYRDMVVSAACCLDNNKDIVNNLNVFPVPDGDTGINMSLTMSGVRGDYTKFEGSLSETSQKAANLMLRGARGNSGVILSLFFRGIGKAWKEVESADCDEVIQGFKRGVSEAYKAVMNPTEGTILTVMRVMTETAEEAYHKGIVRDVTELFPFMYKAADETLQKTPDMLPALKQAGVVDSGGAGFLCVMEGMVKALEGNPVSAVESSKPAIASSADFSTFNTEDIKFAYCTECIVTKSAKYKGEDTADALHQFIMNLGKNLTSHRQNPSDSCHCRLFGTPFGRGLQIRSPSKRSRIFLSSPASLSLDLLSRRRKSPLLSSGFHRFRPVRSPFLPQKINFIFEFSTVSSFINCGKLCELWEKPWVSWDFSHYILFFAVENSVFPFFIFYLFPHFSSQSIFLKNVPEKK